MPMPLSLDLRRRVVNAYENGEGTLQEIAQRFEVSMASVVRWRALVRSGEGLEPMPHSGGKAHQKLFPEHEKALSDWLDQECDLRLSVLAERLLEHHQVQIDPSQISRVLARMDYTRKKKYESS